MSFGLNDNDWIDPPEPEPRFCGEKCGSFDYCPCACGWGICKETGEWVREGDECE